jgi:hypothetical protein
MPWSRRDFMWGASAVAAATAVTTAPHASGAAATATGGTGTSRVKAAGAPVDLVPGLPLGPCRLVQILPVERGALPFELEDPAGRRFVVEVHRHTEGVAALRRAGSCDVFLRNGGSGSTPTNETHGLGAMALASLLAAHEAYGKPLPQLGTIVERWSSDPPPQFR